MQNIKIPNPGLITGAIVGAMLTAPLIAFMYLADQIAGLPFVPFDFFQWTGKVLPGDIVRLGINAIVDTVITLNLGETSSAAKNIEQLMALLMVMGAGIAVGAILYRVITQQNIKQYHTAGIITGIGFGVVMALISGSFNVTSTVSPLIQFIWVVFLFTVWGAGMGAIYADLVLDEPVTDENALRLNRRQFLVRLGGATATLTVVGAGLSALLTGSSEEDTVIDTDDNEVVTIPENLPNNTSGNVEPASGTRPEYTPLDDHYRIDIVLRPPTIDGETWRLKVTGLVEQDVEMTLNQLMNDYEPQERFVTMSCISNRVAGDLISTTKWTGVPFYILLDEWNLQADATHLKITSEDGFDEYVSVDMIRNDPRIMLAYYWDDKPLKQKHGFPIRIHIPDLYGMKQPKWITQIEAVNEWDEGYWVRRRWSATARVQTTSVIDTVSVDSAYEVDDKTYIPIGGIAYSGAKGISKVEVQVDDGDWQEAQLREPLSDTTWYIWRYDWQFVAGDHDFNVRTYTAEGVQQETRRQDTFPDGATGIHSVSADIKDVQPEATPEATAEPNA